MRRTPTKADVLIVGNNAPVIYADISMQSISNLSLSIVNIAIRNLVTRVTVPSMLKQFTFVRSRSFANAAMHDSVVRGIK